MSTTEGIPSKVIVLLSGGMDSATCLGIAKAESNEVMALSFNYNQIHKRELGQAKKIAEIYHVKHITFDFAFADHFNKSTIIYAGHQPLGNDYMPFRNLIIFSVAFGYAQAHGYDKIMYGANADDVFPDNLEPFLIKVNEMLEAMQADIKLVYPLMYLDKAGIINRALELKVPLQLTRTCYNNGEKSCGKCLACKKRLEGFEKAGKVDPLDYD